jgi:hypothetical protein
MKRINQLSHDNMVRKAFNHLQSENFRDIRVDLTGYKQPEKITWKKTGLGHIPDLSAQNGNLNIFEVETVDSISDSHTEDQWTLFSAFAKQNRAEFWVVVPSGHKADANSRLIQLNIQAKVWEI